ncbi:DNA-binding response OmpR family regulator [Marinobacterium sp. MBR-111]|jgi:DNA-binding response OmpR family regulator|uniref:winged helix family transcriptional regulator n=1 Tax=Marinobacterium sp. MBR-111 TaxID=3156463 RepID=UPI003399AECC
MRKQEGLQESTKTDQDCAIQRERIKGKFAMTITIRSGECMKIIIFSDVPAMATCDQIETDFCVRPECVITGKVDNILLKKYQALLDTRESLVILISSAGYKDSMESVLGIRSCSSVPIILAANNLSRADEYILRNAGVDDFHEGLEYDTFFCLQIRSAKRWIDRFGNYDEKNNIRFGNWVFQKNMSVVVSPDRRSFRISQKEYRFLELLLKRQGDIITRSEISKYVFKREWDPTDKSIDVLVSKLRCRFRKEKQYQGPAIENVRGVGYTLILN